MRLDVRWLPRIRHDPYLDSGRTLDTAIGSAGALLRVRLGLADAHYAGKLVAGARILELFGDLATELSIRLDGNEGLLRAYSDTEFLAPVHAGDFIEARARVVAINHTSRTCEFEAYKVIAADPTAGPAAAVVLHEPVLVARARGTVVTATPPGAMSEDGNAVVS